MHRYRYWVIVDRRKPKIPWYKVSASKDNHECEEKLDDPDLFPFPDHSLWYDFMDTINFSSLKHFLYSQRPKKIGHNGKHLTDRQYHAATKIEVPNPKFGLLICPIGHALHLFWIGAIVNAISVEAFRLGNLELLECNAAIGDVEHH
jgi:hypothetical protein